MFLDLINFVDQTRLLQKAKSNEVVAQDAICNLKQNTITLKQGQWKGSMHEKRPLFSRQLKQSATRSIV